MNLVNEHLPSSQDQFSKKLIKKISVILIVDFVHMHNIMRQSRILFLVPILLRMIFMRNLPVCTDSLMSGVLVSGSCSLLTLQTN